MTISAPLRLIWGVVGAICLMSAAAAPADAYRTPRLKPAAPGPQYLSPADHARLTLINDSIEKKNFGVALRTIDSVEAPIAKSLGQWLYFLAKDPGVDLEAADQFLDNHFDWPAISRIQRHLEEEITNGASPDFVMRMFDSRDPLTGHGKIQLARALLANGDKDAAVIHIRDAWVNHNFEVAEERSILRKYGKYLHAEDHVARVDRLLWSRQVTNAKRVFSRLDSKNRRTADARAQLILGASSAAATYRNLAEDERLDSGVLLAAVRYFRRRGDEQYAISLAAQSPKDPETLRNSARWWYERQLLMRWALKNGRFADAYTASAEHGMDAGGNFADAEFNAGWIALRFLDDPERAENHFLALASAVGTPISLSRSFYWLGRATEAAGKDVLSQSHYNAASQYVYSYYGQLAAEKVGGTPLQSRFGDAPSASPADAALFSSRPTVAALRMLTDLDFDYPVMVFAYHVDDQLERPGEYIELSKLLMREGAPHLTVRAGKVAVRKDAFVPDVSYPLVYVPEEAKRYVSPEIILGLSRQESEFNPRAYSRAGARGVMQLIPTTAQITAKKEGLAYKRSALLDDPIYNMTLGSAHLSHLLDRYDGSLIMTFAAYNAGAGRVTQWVDTYGDPRSADVDPLDWVELIPFAETRNYVQRVLENVQVYRGRLNNTPIAGRLSADLERGGASRRAAIGNSPSTKLIEVASRLNSGALPATPTQTVERAREFRASLAAYQPQTPSIEDLLAVELDSQTASTTPSSIVAVSADQEPTEPPEGAAKVLSFVESGADDAKTPVSEQRNQPSSATKDIVANASLVDASEAAIKVTPTDKLPRRAPIMEDIIISYSPPPDADALAATVSKNVIAPTQDALATTGRVSAPPAEQPAPTASLTDQDDLGGYKIYRPGEPSPTDNEANDLNARQQLFWSGTAPVADNAAGSATPSAAQDAALSEIINSVAPAAASNEEECEDYLNFLATASELEIAARASEGAGACG
ncbi:MAG: transglycosylase SLT domain-containing protein [Pseudomonadota bacterium]